METQNTLINISRLKKLEQIETNLINTITEYKKFYKEANEKGDTSAFYYRDILAILEHIYENI